MNNCLNLFRETDVELFITNYNTFVTSIPVEILHKNIYILSK